MSTSKVGIAHILDILYAKYDGIMFERRNTIGPFFYEIHESSVSKDMTFTQLSFLLSGLLLYDFMDHSLE